MKYICIVLLLLTTLSYAQSISGSITYKTEVIKKNEIKKDSVNPKSNALSWVMQVLENDFEKEYILLFNKTESIYKESEKLGSPVKLASFNSSDVYYRKVTQNHFLEQKEILGKLFLIKDTLTNFQWKLTNETKIILGYKCYKARTTKKVNLEIEGKVNLKEIDIVAWFSPKIHASHGPEEYWGLPGLILEVHSDDRTKIVCSKIVIEPKGEKEIKVPKKGKMVSQKEYDEIMKRKVKEMQEIYGGN